MGYEEGGNINPADLPMSREGLPTYEDIETGEEVDYPYKIKRWLLLQTLMQNYFKCI
jgi:hypothetical protein